MCGNNDITLCAYLVTQPNQASRKAECFLSYDLKAGRFKHVFPLV